MASTPRMTASPSSSFAAVSTARAVVSWAVRKSSHAGASCLSNPGGASPWTFIAVARDWRLWAASATRPKSSTDRAAPISSISPRFSSMSRIMGLSSGTATRGVIVTAATVTTTRSVREQMTDLRNKWREDTNRIFASITGPRVSGSRNKFRRQRRRPSDRRGSVRKTRQPAERPW